MNFCFLIPPSEWKKSEWCYHEERVQEFFEKPLSLFHTWKEKDLKCKQKRFEEATYLNHHINNGPFEEVMKRYSWVLYKAINFSTFSKQEKDFFNTHFRIISWMYGILHPNDIIWNYKLPIEASWLIKYWKQTISQSLEQSNFTHIINLLPKSYSKLLDTHIITKPIFTPQFIDTITQKQLTHNGKSIKWLYIRHLVQNQISNISDIYQWKYQNVIVL